MPEKEVTVKTVSNGTTVSQWTKVLEDGGKSLAGLLAKLAAALGGVGTVLNDEGRGVISDAVHGIGNVARVVGSYFATEAVRLVRVLVAYYGIKYLGTYGLALFMTSVMAPTWEYRVSIFALFLLMYIAKSIITVVHAPAFFLAGMAQGLVSGRNVASPLEVIDLGRRVAVAGPNQGRHLMFEFATKLWSDTVWDLLFCALLIAATGYALPKGIVLLPALASLMLVSMNQISNWANRDYQNRVVLEAEAGSVVDDGTGRMIPAFKPRHPGFLRVWLSPACTTAIIIYVVAAVLTSYPKYAQERAEARRHASHRTESVSLDYRLSMEETGRVIRDFTLGGGTGPGASALAEERINQFRYQWLDHRGKPAPFWWAMIAAVGLIVAVWSKPTKAMALAAIAAGLLMAKMTPWDTMWALAVPIGLVYIMRHESMPQRQPVRLRTVRARSMV